MNFRAFRPLGDPQLEVAHVLRESWHFWPLLEEVEAVAGKGPGAEPDAGTRCAFLVASHHLHTAACRSSARFILAIGTGFHTCTRGCALLSWVWAERPGCELFWSLSKLSFWFEAELLLPWVGGGLVCKQSARRVLIFSLWHVPCGVRSVENCKVKTYCCVHLSCHLCNLQSVFLTSICIHPLLFYLSSWTY